MEGKNTGYAIGPMQTSHHTRYNISELQVIRAIPNYSAYFASENTFANTGILILVKSPN